MGESNKSGGFTILETVIVLAIGGLMLLMVFYMIPALQRNSRNTTRKNDVAIILDKLASFQLNHSGAMPASTDDFLANAKLNYYNKSSITFFDSLTNTYPTDITIVATNGGVVSAPEENNSSDKVVIYNYRKCNDTLSASVSSAAGFRDVIALYGIETSNGSASKCIQM